MKPKDNEIMKDRPQLILASGSPRRVELLKKMGLDFIVSPSRIEEVQNEGESAMEFAKRASLDKVRAKLCEIPTSARLAYILGADTIVVLENQVFGKPYNHDMAHLHLEQLSGKTHEVMTGYALLLVPDKIIVHDVSVSQVKFRRLLPKQIRDYVATGEPLDKAGSYAIQGIGKKFIEKVEGSYNNVVGLPTEDLVPWFKKVGLL